MDYSLPRLAQSAEIDCTWNDCQRASGPANGDRGLLGKTEDPKTANARAGCQREKAMKISPGFIQLSGTFLAAAIVINEGLTLIRDWRGGSPELRIIRDQLGQAQAEQNRLLQRILDRVDSLTKD